MGENLLHAWLCQKGRFPPISASPTTIDRPPSKRPGELTQELNRQRPRANTYPMHYRSYGLKVGPFSTIIELLS